MGDGHTSSTSVTHLGFNAGAMGLRATGVVEGGQSKDNEDQWGGTNPLSVCFRVPRWVETRFP